MNTRAAVKRVKTELDIKKNTIKKAVDVQAKPVAVDNYPNPIYFKVDICICLDGAILIGGWASSEFPLTIKVNEKTVPVKKIKFERNDVNDHLNLPSGSKSGFALIIEDDFKKPKSDKIELSWELKTGKEQGSTPLVMVGIDELQPYDHLILGPAFFEYLNQVSFNSSEWKKLLPVRTHYLSSCNSAKAFIEIAKVSDSLQEAVVVGWIVSKSNFRIWLEDQSGHIYDLNGAYWYHRKDLNSISNELNMIGSDNGFMLRISELKSGAQLYICGQDDDGIYVLGEIIVNQFPDGPLVAAKFLFDIPFPKNSLISRFKVVDQFILGRLIRKHLSLSKGLKVRKNSLGSCTSVPIVSIIIPIYGTCDFVENQMLQFSRDTWISQNAEIIYVIDDNLIYESFVDQINTLHRLLRVPVKFIWIGQNIGFSAANNLGAQNSTGKYLLFLNSDVFPQNPFWLEKLVDVLESDSNIGAVGPRLVFSDGSIQSVGSTNKLNVDSVAWLKRYQHKGIEPILDSDNEIVTVDCISGACLLVARVKFDQLGGWDTSYLIGDFEGSDLCMKLRRIGLKIAYNPHVQLTHLEGQSLKYVGDDIFIKKVMLYNLILYQSRWNSLSENSTEIK